VRSGPQHKEKVIFLTKDYCPDPIGSVRTFGPPSSEDGGALPNPRVFFNAPRAWTIEQDLAEASPAPLHQPELFPPPVATVWTAARSCASLPERQALVGQLVAEIRWRSTQLHELKRSAKGRILDCCDYFDGRKFTLQELKRRCTSLQGLIHRSAEFQAMLESPTRREARRRKSAPLHLRLTAYLDPIAQAGGGSWKVCPTYDKLAESLDVCLESISQAFKHLEEDPECPFSFACAYSGPQRCRQKLVALKSWLKFDRLPLHFEEEGRDRKLRATFRKGEERIPPPPLVAARYGCAAECREEVIGDRPSPPVSVAPEPQENHGFQAGNSEKCLSHSTRLSPAVLDNPQPSPVKPVSRPLRPNPRDAALSNGSRKLENAAWRAAREAKADGELFWDNAKPKIPVATLKTLILEAFQRGFEWQKHVRPALIYGIKEAHAAACLSHIHNPGAFAAAIYRTKLASMRPDLDQLAEVIATRRKKLAAEKDGQAILDTLTISLSSPDPEAVTRRNQAECRAMDRLAAYIGEHQEALSLLSPDMAETMLFAKMREFTKEEYEIK